jgi:hypothetical protein
MMRAILAVRIDRLPSEEKQLLQTGSVIGTEVPLALLQAMAEAPEESRPLGLSHLHLVLRLFGDIPRILLLAPSATRARIDMTTDQHYR